MKKIDLGQALTLIANVGVIGGLVLVALELRQTSNAVLGATFQARSETGMEWNSDIAHSEFVPGVAIRYREGGFESLSEEDKYRMQSIGIAAYYRLDGYLLQSELGLLPDASYEIQFRAEMETWVPRWRDWKLLEQSGSTTSFISRHMRPSFAREVSKYIDGDNEDLRWLQDVAER